MARTYHNPDSFDPDKASLCETRCLRRRHRRLERTLTDDDRDHPTTPTSHRLPRTPTPAAPPAPAPASAVRRAPSVRLPSARATAVLAGGDARTRRGGRRGHRPGARRLLRGSLAPALAAPVADRAGRGGRRALRRPSRPAARGRRPGDACAGRAREAARGRAGSAVAPLRRATSPDVLHAESTEAVRPGSRRRRRTTKSLPPVTHVWLIELSGTTFAEALAQPSAAPYIDGQAVPAGALLSGWSALDASAFAGDAALIASTPAAAARHDRPASLPRRRRRRRSAPPARPAGLTAADEFLKATVPTITAHGRLPHERPDRRHLRLGRRGLPPAGLPSGAVDRDAHIRAAGGRAADLALRVRGHAADHDLFRPIFTKAEPRKAPAPMTDPSTNERRLPLHAVHPAHRTAMRGSPRSWALSPCFSRSAAPSHADEANPNNYTCQRPHRRGRSRKSAAKNSRCSTRSTATARSPATSFSRRFRVTGVEASPLVSSLVTQNAPHGHVLLLGRNPGLRGQLRRRHQGGLREDHRRVRDRHQDLRRAPRRSAAHRHLRVPRKKASSTQAISGPFDSGRPKGCRCRRRVGA